MNKLNRICVSPNKSLYRTFPIRLKIHQNTVFSSLFWGPRVKAFSSQDLLVRSPKTIWMCSKKPRRDPIESFYEIFISSACNLNFLKIKQFRIIYAKYCQNDQKLLFWPRVKKKRQPIYACIFILSFKTILIKFVLDRKLFAPAPLNEGTVFGIVPKRQRAIKHTIVEWCKFIGWI